MLKKQKQAIILIVGSISLLTSLSGSSINLALPQIAVSLNISSSAATWVVVIGLITSSLFLVMFGHLGDLISKNTVFLYGGVIFVIGSGIAGLAPTFLLLLGGRVIQAIGIAMTMANAMGIVSDYFSNQERAEALAVISMFIAVGSISGPAFGGMIITVASWRWLLLLNVPLGAVILWLGTKILKSSQDNTKLLKQVLQKSNWRGQIIFSIGLILFFFGSYLVQKGLTQSWLGILLLLIGTAITTASFLQDSRSSSPWIDVNLYKNGTYVLSISMLFIVMLVNAVSNILLPFYLQSFQGLTPLVSGLLMMIQSLAMFVVTPIAGYLADHWNRLYLTAIGVALLLVAQIGYALYPMKLAWLIVIGPILLNGIGLALFLSPNNALTMASVNQKIVGVAGSLNSLARTLGMTLGISMASTLLFAQMPGIKRITPQDGTLFLHAYAVVFWVTTGLTMIGLGIVGFRLTKQRQTKS
jgi:MFS family permease